ncbi:GPI-GlcNAc transferase complex, PIG-H component-domain-containing protein [Nemania serpens]|nr:GPI-GlcNAc transferase complex, PIG-H component-domain-containing protein [Nemania serpens]
MLTTTPYLRIRRPSPTAVEFTVSTLPPLTLAVRLSLYAIYLVQGLLSLLLLLLIYATWARSPYCSLADPSPSPSPSPSLHHVLLRALLASPPVLHAAHMAQRVAPRVLVPACLSALYALAQRPYAEESLLVLRGLGIQTRSSRGNVLRGRAATRFIPTEKIRDVLVNEAFRGFEVRCYLVVVVEGEPDVVVVFPRLLPSAPVVERVWAGVRECLYLRKGGDGDGNGIAAGGDSYGRD